MEFSMLWETQTGTGDGANSYTQQQSNDYFRYFDLQDPATQGVALNGGGLDSLEVTGTSMPLDVASGAAVCWLRYWNDAATTVTVAPPVSDTGGRVVLETDWATNTTRLVVLLNTVGNTAAPALTQTVGVIWQVPLASFVIDSSGDVWTDSGKLTAGVVDERVYLGQVTKTHFIPTAISGMPFNISTVDGTWGFYGFISESVTKPAAEVRFFGTGMVPSDYIGGGFIDAIVKVNGATGTFDIVNTAYFGPVNSAGITAAVASGLYSIGASYIREAFRVDGSNGLQLSANDWLSFSLTRDNTQAGDTGGEIDILGWRLTYQGI